jgi:hypothetical protein
MSCSILELGDRRESWPHPIWKSGDGDGRSPSLRLTLNILKGARDLTNCRTYEAVSRRRRSQL